MISKPLFSFSSIFSAPQCWEFARRCAHLREERTQKRLNGAKNTKRKALEGICHRMPISSVGETLTFHPGQPPCFVQESIKREEGGGREDRTPAMCVNTRQPCYLQHNKLTTRDLHPLHPAPPLRLPLPRPPRLVLGSAPTSGSRASGSSPKCRALKARGAGPL